jgi:hypothetical protein
MLVSLALSSLVARISNNSMISQDTKDSSRNMETAHENDEVIPARFWDTNDVFQKLVMEFTYRFDDVLDAEKLKSSLERLLEIGEWKNLGARFKKNVGSVKAGDVVHLTVTDKIGRQRQAASNSTSRLNTMKRDPASSGHTRHWNRA